MTVLGNRRQKYWKIAPETKFLLILFIIWTNCLAQKIWRNSIFGRKSSGRFLHGQPLKRSSLIFRRIKDENACPSYMTELLTRNSDRHTRASRYGKYNLVSPSHNRETEEGRTFQASGTKLLNSIPLDIWKKDSIGSFKSSVRKYFLAKSS